MAKLPCQCVATKHAFRHFCRWQTASCATLLLLLLAPGFGFLSPSHPAGKATARIGRPVATNSQISTRSFFLAASVVTDATGATDATDVTGATAAQQHDFRSFVKTSLLPKLRRVAQIAGAAHVERLLVIWILGWWTLPLSNYFYDRRTDAKDSEVWEQEITRDGSGGAFRTTRLFQIANHVSQAAKIALLVYIVDIFTTLIFPHFQIRFPYQRKATNWVAKLSYTLWASLRFMKFKRHLIDKAVLGHHHTISRDKRVDLAIATPTQKEKMGQAKVYNTVANIFISAATALFLLDFLGVEMGRGLSSLFAFGSLGTVIISFASKDLAASLVNGLALRTSDKFYEGELIMLGDGTRGIVVKIGWMDTLIRGSDEIVQRIPNSQIVNQRVQNLTRMKKCQVFQKIRFRFTDAKRLSKTVQDIRTEIKRACGPKLITDGTRPFRVRWHDFNDDHLEVIVDCRFNDVNPSGEEYYEIREKVLEAIVTAVEKNNLDFALPAAIKVEYDNNNNNSAQEDKGIESVVEEEEEEAEIDL